MSHETHYPQDEVALNKRINKLMEEWNKIDSIGGDLDVFTATVDGKKWHIFNT